MTASTRSIRTFFTLVNGAKFWQNGVDMMNLCGLSLYDQGILNFELELRKKIALPQTISIATPNPEMCLAAMKDSVFLKILQQCTFRIPDGFGLTLMAKILGKGTLERVSGVDILPIIAKLAAEQQWTIVMIGGNEPVGSDSCNKAAQVFKEQYPHLNILTFPDILMQTDETPDTVSEALSMSGPCVVMAGLGMKKQETWIMQQATTFPDVKIAVGCGGAFAMIAGTLPRAPRILRVLGLEWLWRVMLEPARIVRIFRAVCVFPIRAALYEWRQNQ